MKHSPHRDDRRPSGVDNVAFDEMPSGRPTTRRSLSITSEPEQPTKVPCLIDFFNPIVAVNCIKVIVRKRPHNARRVVILLLVLYFIAIGPAFGNSFTSKSITAHVNN